MRNSCQSFYGIVIGREVQRALLGALRHTHQEKLSLSRLLELAPVTYLYHVGIELRVAASKG